MEPTGSFVKIVERLERWDEVLDTKLPLFIEASCGKWEEVSRDLIIAGLSAQRQIWLSQDGEKHSLEIHDGELFPKPDGPLWSLTILPAKSETDELRPLSCRHFVLLRARGQNSELAGMLSSLGARVSCLPMLKFVEPDDLMPLTRSLKEISHYDAVLFTSRNGVSHFLDRLLSQGFDYRILAKKTIIAIGPGTAATLLARGFKADLIASENVAEGLVRCLVEHFSSELPGKRFLFPRAQVARDHIGSELRLRGAIVDDIAVYKTVSPTPSAEQLQSIGPTSVLVVTSSSTAKHWAQVSALRPPCVCIGPICAETAHELGFPVLGTAPEHNLSGLVDFIAQKFGESL